MLDRAQADGQSGCRSTLPGFSALGLSHPAPPAPPPPCPRPLCSYPVSQLCSMHTDLVPALSRTLTSLGCSDHKQARMENEPRGLGD